METRSSRIGKGGSWPRLALRTLAVTALVLSTFTVAAADAPVPFIGSWRGLDFDGGIMRLTIAGPAAGPLQITWTEAYFGGCAGGAGIVRGTAVLSESDPNALQAHLQLECFTTGDSFAFDLLLRYHPQTGTLSSRYSAGTVTIWRRPGQLPPSPEALYLRVNYGHGWVESFYESGHMAWITVTEADGVTVKAAAEVITEPKEIWNWSSGFQTQDSDWQASRPDIVPGDWVFGWLDNGATAQVQIGDIRGRINLTTDAIQGTILAEWFTSAVDVECFPWGAPEPQPDNKHDSILPDGTQEYACSWDGEWDIQPWQDVGIGYFGADGHWVANAFSEPIYEPRIVASAAGDWLWTTGFAPAASLTISVYESSAAEASLLWTGTATADEWGFVLVGADQHELDLMPANYLTVIDAAGGYEKGLELEAISMLLFDPDLEVMAGFAPGGRQISVTAGMAEAETQSTLDVSANPATGWWFADFNTVDFDITEDMRPWSFAQIFDADWDANEADPLYETESLIWANAYTYDLPAGSWSAGSHAYHFEAEWLGGEETSLDIPFSVSTSAEPYAGYVLLRPGAVRARVGGDCPAIDAIHPDQPTRFLAGWTTIDSMTYAQAVDFFDGLTSRAVWDGGSSASLAPHEIIPFSLDTWFQYVCSFTAMP